MTYRLRVAHRASRQIREAADWWHANRPTAPTAFADEVGRGFELICSLPGVGEPVAQTRLPELRRLLLGRVHYYLYYVTSRDEGSVEVLALWHTRRREIEI